jgi:RNA recognition motif-containing protein
VALHLNSHINLSPFFTADYDRSLYVGNLPYTATEEEVWNMFSKHAKVLEVSLMPRGYGFIDFATVEDVKNVMKVVNANPHYVCVFSFPSPLFSHLSSLSYKSAYVI